MAMLAVLIGAQAATPAGASRPEPEASAEMRLNAYARARLAEADGALLEAASAYREAVELDPGSVEVTRRGFRQAVLAGDMPLALRSARILDAAGQLPRDGTVLLLIDALERREWGQAGALVDRLEKEENLAFLVPFMRSWMSMRSEEAYEPPVVSLGEAYAAFAVRYLEEQLLLQRLALGDAAGAREAYIQAKKRDTAFGPEERWAIAARFDALGQDDLALELVQNAMGDDGNAAAALKRARKLYRKNRFTPQYGLAMLMNRLAQDLANHSDGTAPLSIVRVASFAVPQSDDIRLGVARAALIAGYEEAAYREAGLIDDASPAWFDAQAVRLRALMEQGREDEAIARAHAIVEGAQDDPESWRLLGDTLIRAGDYAGAARAYNTIRGMLGGAENPALLLQLGGALEQAGEWEKARPLLEKVVELAPDSPVALNHLGYALADRGEDLPQAIELLEKANRLRPGEAAFIDSLGWAFHRAGKHDKALPLIQQAVALEPGNAELNDHMGDILWAMGRHFEARYAWKAALTGLGNSKQDLRLRAAIAEKLRGEEAAYPLP